MIYDINNDISVLLGYFVMIMCGAAIIFSLVNLFEYAEDRRRTWILWLIPVAVFLYIGFKLTIKLLL